VTPLDGKSGLACDEEVDYLLEKVKKAINNIEKP
jgi:hypothetical protein